MPRLRRSESSLREPDITLEGVPEDEHDDVAEKARNYVRRQLKPPSSKNSKLDEVRFEKVGDRYLVWWEYDDYSVTLADGRPGYHWSWGVWVTPDELAPPEVAAADPASRPAAAPEAGDEPAVRPLPEPPKPPEPGKAGPEPAATPDAPKSTLPQPKAAEPQTTEPETAKPKSTVPSDTPGQDEPSATPKAEPKTADAQPDAEPPAAKPRPETTPSQPVSEPVLLPEQMDRPIFVPEPVGRDRYLGHVHDLPTYTRTDLQERQNFIDERSAREQEGAKEILAPIGEATVITTSLLLPTVGLVIGGARTFHDTYTRTGSITKAIGATGVNTLTGVAGGKLAEKLGTWVVGKSVQHGLSGTGQKLLGMNVDAAGNAIGDKVTGTLNDALFRPENTTPRRWPGTVRTSYPPSPVPPQYERGGITVKHGRTFQQ